MSDSMSISSQESIDSSDSVSVTDEEWKQIEKDLVKISLLQEDAVKRMERLSVSLLSSSSVSSDIRALQNIIQQCHEQSLQQQQTSQTHTVHFGQLLLQQLST